MRGRGDDVRVRDGRRVQPRRDQPGEVRHVHHQVRPDLVGDPPERGEVEMTGVGRPARDDQLGPVLAGEPLDLVHVHEAVALAHVVGHDVVEPAGEVDPHAVGEVAAVREVETEDGVTRFEQRGHGRRVGLRPRVGLHVGGLGAEQRLHPVDRQPLDHVDVLAAAVVAPARVALRVLVGEHRALRLHDRDGREVLRGDHLQGGPLAARLRADRRRHLRVGLGQRHVHHRIVHFSPH